MLTPPQELQVFDPSEMGAAHLGQLEPWAIVIVEKWRTGSDLVWKNKFCFGLEMEEAGVDC
jgi:hypothetical protein